MTKKEFKEKIRRGLGSAIIELMHCEDVSVYKDIVLCATLSFTAFNRPSEGARHHYLYEAISFFSDKDFFQDKIIDSIDINTKDLGLFDQLTGLLCLFAGDGSIKAKDYLYNLYEMLFKIVLDDKKRYKLNYKREHLEHLCNNLVYLDGETAFNRITDDLSKYYLGNPKHDPFDFDWFYVTSSNVIGRKKVISILTKKKVNYSFNKPFTKNDNRMEQSEEEILESFKKPGYLGIAILREMEKNDDSDGIKMVLNAIYNESDLDLKAHMLNAFYLVDKFYGDIDILIEYTKTENERLREVSYDMLKKLKSDILHDYAIELLKNRKDIDGAIALLIKNFKKSDSMLLIDVTKEVSLNRNLWHAVFSNVLDVIRNNKEAPLELLTYTYEKTLCSCCREFIVLEMKKRKMINQYLLDEISYDSNADIREIAVKMKKF